MGWNGSGQKGTAPAQTKVTAKKPSPWRGLVAGAIVVSLAAGGAYFLLCKPAAQVSDDDLAAKRQIRAQRPAKVKKPSAPDDPAVSKGKPRPEAAAAKTGENRAAAAPEASETVATNAAEDKKPKDNRLFKNPMDQLLLMVMPKHPGGTVPPLPNIDSLTFTPEEEDRMLERLAVAEDDTDETLDRKELVQSLRDEYHELKKSRNWSFVDYVKALDAKVRLDAEVMTESINLHETVFNDKSITDAEYAEALEKINKVLADRGIPPIGQQDEEGDAPEAGDANVNPEQKEAK